MENIRQKIAEIITHTHKTPLEQADEILLLFNVSGRSEQCCSPTDGFYLGTTCPHCNKPFRKDIR